MAIEDIKKELEKRFSEPLEEDYKRRIIFWNDEDHDFLEDINSLELSNAKVLVLNETNQFESKKLLSSDDQTSNYLVYNPLIIDHEHDWFLDIKLYSEEYRADKTSRLMQEMHITNTPELRDLVKTYAEFFKNSKRRNALASLNDSINKRDVLIMSILSVIAGVKEVKPEAIIRAVIASGTD